MFNFLSTLSTKIISMALLLAIFPLGIVYFVASSLFTETLIESIQQNLTAQAIQAGHSIDQFFHQRMTDIKMLSQADVFEGNEVDEINQYLEEIQIENDLLFDIYVVMPSGEFLAIAKDEGKISKNIKDLMPHTINQLFSKTLNAKQGDVLVSEAIWLDESLKVVLMTPITDAANINVVKVLIVELDLNAVNDIVSHFQRSLVGNKSVYIVDNDGHVVVTPDENSELLKPFKDLSVNPDLLEAFSIQGENGSIIYTDAANDEVVAGFADMAEFGINHALDWSIIGLAPIKEIAAPVYSLHRFLIWLTLSLICVTVIAAILVGRSISKPILQVVNVVSEISNGNLEKDIAVVEKGEVGQLSYSISKMQKNMRDIANTAKSIAEGNLDISINVLSEYDILSQSLCAMVDRLRQMRDEQTRQNWLKTGLNDLNEKISGEQELVTLSENIISFLTPYLDAQVSAFYLYIEPQTENEQAYLKMAASYAYVWRKQLSNKILIGEGLIGQVALECKSIVLTHLTADYIYIASGLGETTATSILATPFLYEGKLKGVIEFATLTAFTPLHLDFLTQTMPIVGIAVNTAESRAKVQALLINSQQQTRELEEKSIKMMEQQQALREANEVLQTQSEELQAQSEELQTQQEELSETNKQLEFRTKDLERQKEEIRLKNEMLEATQQEIERKARELEVSGQYKSEFLANMSHELRTPLNGILGYAQLLQRDRELNEKQKNSITVIQQCADHLLDLINDILDLSKIEAGQLELVFSAFHLPAFLRSVVELMRLRAEQKEIDFVYVAPPTLPETIKTDEKRLRQILLNILSNAIKFTHQGQVTFTVHYQSSQLFFQVKDTGIGISPADIDKIFLPFRQVGPKNKIVEGTGLGLPITKKLIEMLQGTVQVTSELGQGSTFEFFVQVQETDEYVVENTLLSKRIIGFEAEQPITLLIADDKWQNRALLNEFLKPLGFELLEARNGQETLEKTKKFHPNAILMELVMPTLDGFDCVRQIRQHSEFDDVIIIALSADVFISNQQACLDAGCQTFLAKPVNFEQLLQVLGKYLSLEWVYEIDEDECTQACELPFVGPSIEQAKVLHELIMSGDIQGIINYSQQLEQEDASLRPFSQQVYQLAKNFQEVALEELIMNYLK